MGTVEVRFLGKPRHPVQIQVIPHFKIESGGIRRQSTGASQSCTKGCVILRLQLIEEARSNSYEFA